MTKKIRQYKMNGSLIIGVDAGYGNYKTAEGFFLQQSVQARNYLYLRRIISRWMGNIILLGKVTRDLWLTR